MTADFSEKVLVLQVGRFKEADLWVRFLSPTRGLLSAFAFGGSRSRRRFVGCLDVFNEIHVRVNSEKRGRYLALQEGVLVKGLSRLRTDWGRLGLAVNCSRFLQCFGIGAEGAERAHGLFQDTLLLLEGETAPHPMLPAFFRARLAFGQGYDLQTGSCSGCGRPLGRCEGTAAFLLLHEGQIFCPACNARQQGGALALDADALHLLETIRHSSPAAWGNLHIAPSAARQCARVIDGFIQYHVGIRWHEGRFIRQ